MKHIISTVLIILAAFVLQTTVFQALALADVVPNLLLIVTVACGYMGGEKEGLLVGLCCGLMNDLFFGDIIGLYALIFMSVGFLNGIFNKIYYTNDLIIPLILISISDFLYNFYYFITEFLLRGRIDFFFYMRRIILPEMVYTVLISVVLYKLLHMLRGSINREDAKEV